MPPGDPRGYDRARALRALLRARPDAALSPDDIRLLEETQTPAALGDFAARAAAQMQPPAVAPGPDMRLAQAPVPAGADPTVSDVAAAYGPGSAAARGAAIQQGGTPYSPEAALAERLFVRPEARQPAPAPDAFSPRTPAPAAPQAATVTGGTTRARQIPHGGVTGRPVEGPADQAALVEGLGPAQGALGGLANPSPPRGGTEGILSLAGHDAAGIVVDVPGVGQTRIPWEALRDDEGIRAFFGGILTRGVTGDTGIGPDGSLSLSAAGSARLEGLTREYLARLRAGQGAAGPGGPRMDASVRSRVTVPGEASPESLAMLAGAIGDERGARAGHDAATLAVSAGQEGAGAALGGAQTAAALEQEARLRERSQRLQEAFQGVQRRIEDVGQMRVNVDEALGGFGGRMTAAIAVALGQLGSALGGGENAALALINQAVDRNLAAQRSNIEAARGDVSARQNALQQMRGLLGDEAASEDAARAMHLTAISTRLNGVLAGLTGEERAAAIRLRDAVQTLAQRAQAVAQERAANSSRFDTTYRVRGSAPAVMAQVQGIQGMGARPAAVPAGQAPAPAASGGTRQTPAGSGGARALPGRSRGAGFSLRGAQLASASDATAAFDALAENRPPPLPPGLRPIRRDGVPDPGWLATFQRNTQTGQERTQYRDLTTAVRLWTTWVPEILRVNQQFHAEASDAEARVAHARQMAGILRREVVHMMSGAAFTPAEREEYLNALPDPNAIDASNVTEMWNTLENRWAGFARSWVARATVGLNNFGLEPDTAARIDPQDIPLIQRAQEAARAPARAAEDESGFTARDAASLTPLGAAFDAFEGLRRWYAEE